MQLVDDSASQSAEMFNRPQLGTAVSAARVQGDHATITANVQISPYLVGRFLVGSGRGQLKLLRLGRTTSGGGQRQVCVDHGRFDNAATLSTRIQLFRQQRPSTVASVSDAFSRAAKPRQHAGAKGICKQYGHVESLRTHALDQRQPAEFAVFGSGVEVPLFAEPICAGQHVGQVGPHDSHDFRFATEVSAQGA